MAKTTTPSTLDKRKTGKPAKKPTVPKAKQTGINTPKTLHNSTVKKAKENVIDLVTYGDGDTFKLICKASSVSEGWMKSTKAMEIDAVGCVIQVTTQQGDNVAEAVTFVPNVCIYEDPLGERSIMRIDLANKLRARIRS